MRKLLRSRLISAWLLLGLLSLFLIGWSASPLAAAGEAGPRRELTRAWEQAGQRGRYNYRTTILQTLHPTLRLENVGRTPRTEQFVIEGEMDARGERMLMQLTVANRPPLQVRLLHRNNYPERVWG